MAQNKPAHQIRLGRIRAAIWANQGENGDAWFNVTMTRTYNDGDGPKDTYSFRRDDLPVVEKVADMAYAWIWENRKSAKTPEQASPSPEQDSPSHDEAEF